MKLISLIIGGVVSLTLLLALSADGANIWYVSQNSPISGPGTSWATAFHDIQSAINVTTNGDTVLVTNGIYNTGGTVAPGNFLTNRVYITNAITLQSVSGPGVTIISGVSGLSGFTNNVRCVYMVANAGLLGFTLTNGGTRYPSGSFSYGPSDLSGGGVYGGILTNCILAGNSAGGSGGGAYGGILFNCTLTNNAMNMNNAGAGGGGAGGCTLYNCLLIGNLSYYSGGGAQGSTLVGCALSRNSGSWSGGGVEGCTLTNCLVTRNSTGQTTGGGADASTLNNCIIVSNNASSTGGGTYDCNLNNCLIYHNSAMVDGGAGGRSTFVVNGCTIVSNTATGGGPGGVDGASVSNSIIVNNYLVSYGVANYGIGTLNYCCTTPLPGSGTGNIAVDPLFINPASGNYRLQTNSPCINAGNNSYVGGITTDLDGRPRIVGGTVDMGAYEFQGPGLGEFTFWLQQYGLPTDGSVDYADSDGTGMNNWQKWIAGLNPTNSASVLAMSSLGYTNSTGVTVTWQSVSNRTYYLLRSSSLATQPFSLIQSNIVGQAGTTSYTDGTAAGSGPYFYRVGVQY